MKVNGNLFDRIDSIQNRNNKINLFDNKYEKNIKLLNEIEKYENRYEWISEESDRENW